MTHRELPHNELAEEAVLAACFMTPAAIDGVRELLTEEDFYLTRTRTVFRAIGWLASKSRELDPITLAEELSRRGELDAAGGKAFIGGLVGAIPTAENLEHYAAILREKAALRRVIEAARAAERAAIEGHDFPAIDAELERAMALIRSRGAGDRVFDDKRAMADGVRAYLAGNVPSGLPYGFQPLDRALLPINPGHFVLLGGASSSGKSTVARNILRQWVQRYDEHVGMLSLEMKGQEQLEGLALIDAQVSAERYYRRQFSDADIRRIEEATAWWEQHPRFKLNEQGAVTPEQALRIFRRWRSEGVTTFVLDHLHRLDYGATRDGELRLPMANFARALKSFAKDFECRVVALVQYSKIKPHEEPDDSKIREANNILEESDGVLHIYRPLVACARTLQGLVVPLTKQDGTGRYFENDSTAPHDCFYAHDPEYVYVKLGKQRRRIRDGLIRIPFNADTWALYDTKRDQ